MEKSYIIKTVHNRFRFKWNLASVQKKKALSNPWLFYAAYCRVFQIKESDAKVMECSCYEQPKIDSKLYILPHN